MRKELSFTRTIYCHMTYFQEESGLIKDRLTSWKWDNENKAFIIRSDEEDDKHEQIIKQNHILFSYDSTTQISKNGLFWNKFDCEEYEWVERLYKSNYYICRKNGKYGIIKDNGDVVIDIVYPLITRLPQIVDVDIDDTYWYEPYEKRQERKQKTGVNVKQYIVIKITTYDGEYLLELLSMKKSKPYDIIYTWGKNYLVRKGDKYGLVSPLGIEVIPPEYSKAYPINETISESVIEQKYLTGGWLEVDFGEKKVPIANNGKYYGVIPLEYEECYYVGDHFASKQYVVKKKGKYGLIKYDSLNNKYGINIPIEYKSIAFNKEKPFYDVYIKDDNNGKSKAFTFAIVQDNKGYQLFNIWARDKNSCREHYQSIEFLHTKRRDSIERKPKEPYLFIAQQNNKYGLLSQRGEPLTDFIYQAIGPMICDVIPVCVDDKWGILNDMGVELIKCEWDEIKSIYRKGAKVKKDGNIIDLKLDNWVKEDIYDKEKEHDAYKGVDMDQELWDALTDGQYGPYPGGDIDYDAFGF